VPLYEDLIRRAMEARDRAESLHRDAGRVRDLAQILRDAHQGHVSIRRCAWCDRFEVGGEWLHLEAIGAGQTRIASSLLERASHGICDECFEREIRRRGSVVPDE
jgi:hypothetical protein